MPYVEQGFRDSLAGEGLPWSPGELNYLVTKMVDDYLRRIGTNYARLNEVVGVLECAKMEFYRRIAAPYEDIKRQENGDVYTQAIKS